MNSDELICLVSDGSHITRIQAEEWVGEDAVRQLITRNILAYNPFTECLEIARPTEEFF